MVPEVWHFAAPSSMSLTMQLRLLPPENRCSRHNRCTPVGFRQRQMLTKRHIFPIRVVGFPRRLSKRFRGPWGNGIHDDNSASLFSTLDRHGMADRRTRRRLCPVPAAGHRSDGGTPLLAGRPLHDLGHSQPDPRDTRTGLSGSTPRPALCHPAPTGSDRSLVGRKRMCLRSLPLHGAHVQCRGTLLWGPAVLWCPADLRHHGSHVCGEHPLVRHCSTSGCGSTSRSAAPAAPAASAASATGWSDLGGPPSFDGAGGQRGDFGCGAGRQTW